MLFLRLMISLTLSLLSAMNKTEQVIRYVRQKRWKEALAIAKAFRMDFKASEKRSIEIASDCMNGSSDFYRQLGINPHLEIEKAKAILTEMYGKS